MFNFIKIIKLFSLRDQVINKLHIIIQNYLSLMENLFLSKTLNIGYITVYTTVKVQNGYMFNFNHVPKIKIKVRIKYSIIKIFYIIH